MSESSELMESAEKKILDDSDHFVYFYLLGHFNAHYLPWMDSDQPVIDANYTDQRNCFEDSLCKTLVIEDRLKPPIRLYSQMYAYQVPRRLECQVTVAQPLDSIFKFRYKIFDDNTLLDEKQVNLVEDADESFLSDIPMQNNRGRLKIYIRVSEHSTKESNHCELEISDDEISGHKGSCFTIEVQSMYGDNSKIQVYFKWRLNTELLSETLIGSQHVLPMIPALFYQFEDSSYWQYFVDLLEAGLMLEATDHNQNYLQTTLVKSLPLILISNLDLVHSDLYKFFLQYCKFESNTLAAERTLTLDILVENVFAFQSRLTQGELALIFELINDTFNFADLDIKARNLTTLVEFVRMKLKNKSQIRSKNLLQRLERLKVILQYFISHSSEELIDDPIKDYLLKRLRC